PAASALLLPATETTYPMVPLLPVVPLVALVLMDLPASLPPETRQGGRLAAPALFRQRCADRRRALTAASAAASIRSAESYWPARSSPCSPAAGSAPAKAARSPARSPCPARRCARC